MELIDIIMKLNGSILPTGDSHWDHDRLESLKNLIELTDELLSMIHKASSFHDRHEASMKNIGLCAKEFLNTLTNYCE